MTLQNPTELAKQQPIVCKPNKIVKHTHSNNSSTTADELFLSVLDHFVGFVLKGLRENL